MMSATFLPCAFVADRAAQPPDPAGTAELKDRLFSPRLQLLHNRGDEPPQRPVKPPPGRLERHVFAKGHQVHLGIFPRGAPVGIEPQRGVARHPPVDSRQRQRVVMDRRPTGQQRAAQPLGERFNLAGIVLQADDLPAGPPGPRARKTPPPGPVSLPRRLRQGPLPAPAG